MLRINIADNFTRYVHSYVLVAMSKYIKLLFVTRAIHVALHPNFANHVCKNCLCTKSCWPDGAASGAQAAGMLTQLGKGSQQFAGLIS